MEKFGNQQFSIWANYFYIEYKDDPDFIENGKDLELGGSVYFWVNGKNLFEFKDCGPDATYGFWDLTVLIEFFCNKLYYHITDDPFPVKTKAIYARDKMDEVSLVEQPDDDLTKYLDVDWDNVDMEERDRIHTWNCNHGMLPNRGGSFLPHLYICKADNKIEVSWRNDYPHKSVDGEFYLKYKEGVEYIDVKLYKDTVIAFCLDFIERFKDKRPQLMQKYRKALQTAIDVKIED